MTRRPWPVLVLLLLLLPLAAGAQIPDKYTNLKVLPKDISRDQLVQTMRGFAIGLGVRCHFCHVGEEGQPFSEWDFASDEKPSKQTARVMLRMVQAINGDYLPQIAHQSHGEAAEHEHEHLQVMCVTCHRGQSRPFMLEQVLAEALDHGGADSAVTTYRALRAQYYGGFTYDFREGVLAGLAVSLVADSNAAAALRMADLNLEFYPESANTWYARGTAHEALGDTAAARQDYERALSIDPRHQGARRRLSALPDS